ncbi:hypothetical protein WJX81_001185 [Elliptochloris bilobata]|uniref:R3H domain-containing protein n=1 Tax=Elliptochloris bilobata TaxID=381761 RepID=A0AAW1SBR6_9CHLO
MMKRPISGGKEAPPRVTASRKWLQIDAQGKMSYVSVDKHTLVLRLNIPYRDLRSLEYSVTNAYQAGILVREKAYVVNLECVKMIVTQDQARRMWAAHAAGAGNGAPGTAGTPHAEGALHHAGGMQGVFPTPTSQFVRDLVARLLHAGTAPLDRDESNMHIDLTLPYELLALETALTACSRGLEADASEIERRVVPQLERLGQAVSRHGLDSVRQDKSVLTRLAARVAKVKQVLEDILNDHQKLEDMYLARRAEVEELGTMQTLPGAPADADSPAMLRAATIMRAATMARAATLARSASLTRRPRVDAVLARLAMLKDRIDATESCIALDLDHRRNELVAYNLALTIFTVAITWVAMTASIFGQNLYFNVATTPLWMWLIATFSSIFMALVGLVVMLEYARRRRLLFVILQRSRDSPAALADCPFDIQGYNSTEQTEAASDANFVEVVLAVPWPEVPEAAEELLDWFSQACRATSDPFQDGDPWLQLRLPATLSKQQRAFWHRLTEHSRLASMSEGVGADRCLAIHPPRRHEECDREADGQAHVKRVSLRVREVWNWCQEEGGRFWGYSQGEVKAMLEDGGAMPAEVEELCKRRMAAKHLFGCLHSGDAKEAAALLDADPRLAWVRDSDSRDYAIHVAVWKGLDAVAAQLALLPGVLEQRDAARQLPLTLARRRGHEAIADALRAAGAQERSAVPVRDGEAVGIYGAG